MEYRYHFALLVDARLINAIEAGSMSGHYLLPTSLTWEGHELLDKIRQQSAWNRVKGIIKDKGLDISYEALKVALGTTITKMF